MKRTPAFSLLELLIVVVFMGILATMAMPRLIRKSPDTSWEHVVDEINNLVYFARQEAISKQKNYRIAFMSQREKNDKIIVEVEEIDPENPNKKIFTQTTSPYYTPVYILPSIIKLEAVFYNKEDQLETNKQKIAYCYIVPNGLVQDVLVHLSKREEECKIPKASLKMAPFFGHFNFHAGYEKPTNPSAN